ncbi:MAG: diguanylate cyclase [Gammaproteobacteria bacterium]
MQDKLQTLIAAYSEKLPEKIQELKLAWQDLQNQYDKAKLAEFHRKAHTLCGSAGTYGYVELSQLVRELSNYLRDQLESRELTTEQCAVISRLLQQIEAVPLCQNKTTFFKSENIAATHKKLIYLLNPDRSFAKELASHFVGTEYELHQLNNLADFMAAIQKKPPAAMIVDVEYLGENEASLLYEWQQNHDIVIPLLCTAMTGNITDRLCAIRAGGSVFLRKPIDIFYLLKMLDQLVGSGAEESFRILIVDDSPSLGEYYSLILQKEGMMTRAISDPLQTLDLIAEFQPDLLLLDVYMPNCTGIELAAVLRQEPLYTHIPIIFLSSEEDKLKQLAALNLGGDDFLTKPILPQHLVAAVRSRAKRAGILSSYMLRDSLTGLLNHSNILHQLEIELIRAKQHDYPLVFAMIDIDNFKTVNDQYGHMIGDRVLKKLSEMLVTHLSKSDYVGRYGGEEFAVILTNTSITAAKKILDDLRKNFSEMHFKGEDYDFTVSISVGIASFENNPSSQRLIEAADQALYKAKREGRNRVTIS